MCCDAGESVEKMVGSIRWRLQPPTGLSSNVSSLRWSRLEYLKPDCGKLISRRLYRKDICELSVRELDQVYVCEDDSEENSVNSMKAGSNVTRLLVG